MDNEYQKKSRVFKNGVKVPTPSVEEVQSYLDLWDKLENYTLQENALNKLFLTVYPTNTEINDILIKVASLNDFYSTNIFSPFKMAKHILELKIDDRLRAGDLTLINDIALLETKAGKTVSMYSFASKYCSHHFPDVYPIYDSYVDDILRHFKYVDRFYEFDKADLKDYPKFLNVILQFQKYYKIEKFNIKKIDRYLWQVGKKHFPRTYK